MAAGAVGDDGVRHTVLRELPRSKLRTLAARASLVHPNVDRQSAIVRGVNRREGRTIIYKSEPAGVAVGQNVDRFIIFRSRNLFDERQAMLSDHTALFYVFGGNLFGSAQSEREDRKSTRLNSSHLGISYAVFCLKKKKKNKK